MKISEHFSDTEFEDSEAGVIAPIHPDLLGGLEHIRTSTGRPVLISSGYRSPEHNKAVGGTGESQHMTNPLRGADIVVPGLSLIDVAAIAYEWEPFRNGGIGVYPKDGHIHVDVRTGGSARWFG